MEKITNDKFIIKAKSFYKKIFNEENNELLQKFYLSLEKIDNTRKKKVVNYLQEDSVPFGNISHHIESFINATKFKFLDLYKGYIGAINHESYSAAIIISRAILENTAMLSYFTDNIIKNLNKKKYLEIVQELLNLSVSLWEKGLVDDYQRIHINDALRHYSKRISDKSSSFIFKIYDPISEFSHPTASSFLVYQTNENNREKMQTTFSLKLLKPKYINLIAYAIHHVIYLVDTLYPYIEINLISKIKKSQTDIDFYFKHDLDALNNYKKMVGKLAENY